MAPGFLDRLRRRAAGRPQPAANGQAPSPGPPRHRPPTPGALRRERRALMRAREERIRDLGGLMLEMHKRDRIRPELLADQCAEVVTLEERIASIDAVLSSLARPVRPQNVCACGAPLAAGAHFCANCGRPTAAAPVVSCAHCGEPLPAEASFCAHCGRAAEAADVPLPRASVAE